MRAILVATRGAMRPLVDRPLIQHLVELMASRSVREIDLILDQDAASIEAILGDGRRWGVVIRHHPVLAPDRPYAAIRALAGDGEEPVLLAHGDWLVDFQEQRSSGHSLSMFSQIAKPSGFASWTGWAIADPAILSRIEPESSRTAIAEILEDAGATSVEADSLRVESDAELMAAQRRILGRGFAGLMLSGRKIRASIYVARNVEIHPSAQIIAPVHIAEDCRIGPRTAIGPNAAIGAGSVIDAGAILTDATICPGTYVGRGLEISHAIAGPRRVVRINDGVIVEPHDPTILGEVAMSFGGVWLRRISDRLAAVAMIAILAPFAAIAWILGRYARLGGMTVVTTPARDDPRRWSTYRLRRDHGIETPSFADLILRVWPGLFHVAAGNLALVGLRPRTVEELLEDREDIRAFTLSHKAGLITEEMVRLEPDSPRIEREMAEASYAATGGFAHDWRLIAGYVSRCFRRSREEVRAVEAAS